jgi:alpha-aminoadipic semialdehyde synthase
MSSERQRCIGVRREDKNRWERRAPVSPTHVAELVKRGIKVIVQPSNLRTYNDRSYREAGAIVQEDLSDADLIIAVKEVPIPLLLEDKAYMFFSHTIKAQPVNMPLLDEILKKRIRLIDYERITDSGGKRLVRFGQFAGYAGMIDMLHALGDRLLAKGYSTPLLHIGYSYVYSRLSAAFEAVKAVGEEIANFGLPKDLCPMTFVFTSEGAVSKGAQEVFKLLPHKMVTPQEMVELVKNKVEDPYTVYGTIVNAEDIVAPNDPNQKFNKAEYYAAPETYHSVFVERYAPYISVIINCMYWDGRFPRLITNHQMKELHEQNKHRLLGVADISADLQGSIEFLMKTTSIDHPLFIYDPRNHDIFDESTDRMYMYRDGILFLAVDNLPTEFPREATQWFGDHLLPFLEQIVKADPTDAKFDDFPPEIKRSVIATHGHLTPSFEYIAELRKIREKATKRVLVLGAGLVAGPAVEYLARNPANTRITIADVSIAAAEKLATGTIRAVKLDVNDSAALDALIGQHSVVVCLVPAVFNPIIAKSCLRMGVHLVSASYIAPEMEALHEQARAAGLTFLNEMGLDPGIDHLEAMNVINDVKAKGGKIRSFVSWCGGLPAPESSDNPLGYKFSWSPRGVLGAATRPAKYKQENEVIEVAGNSIFKRTQQVEIFPSTWLEGIPNRDSLTYAEAYGISDAQTVFRGTLRYRGFCECLEAAIDIGMLDETQQPHLAPTAKDITWAENLRALLHIPAGDKIDIESALRRKLRTPKGFPSKGYDDDKIYKILKTFTWLGLFSDKLVERRGTYIDCFCELLKDKLQYEPRDRDMIILHHIFEIDWPNGKSETKTSTLAHYGEEFAKGPTVMSFLVGLPVAIAAELLLDGVIKERGVIRPVTPDIVVPMLSALKDEGVHFIHKSFEP